MTILIKNPINVNPRAYNLQVKQNELALVYLNKIYVKVHSLKFNHLAMMTGQHRSGKSISTCFFSHLLDKTFWPNFEDRVVYTAEQFMDALETIGKKNIIGGAVVWDEAGVGIPSREWYKTSNKSINYAIQVFGYLRPIIFFVTQDMTYIDSQPRKLFHSFMTAYRGSVSQNIIKPYDISYDKKTGKVYFYYPRFKQKTGSKYSKKYRLKNIILPKPPEKFMEKYENHSIPWKDEIMIRMKKETKVMHIEGVNFDNMTRDEQVNYLMEEYEGHPEWMARSSQPGHPRFDQDMLASHMGLPVRKAKVVCRLASAKLFSESQDEDDEDNVKSEKDVTEGLDTSDYDVI